MIWSILVFSHPHRSVAYLEGTPNGHHILPPFQPPKIDPLNCQICQHQHSGNLHTKSVLPTNLALSSFLQKWKGEKKKALARDKRTNVCMHVGQAIRSL